MSSDTDLKRTPLAALHEELGGRMVPFAGWEMPVQFAGIMAEHKHTRAKASLFDVSHMGQAELSGEDPAAALETLVPGDIAGLEAGRTRYTLLTNDAGGIRDDLMATHLGDRLFLVVNAACKEADFAHIGGSLAGRATLTPLADRALLALQGPEAAAVMARLAPGACGMPFMSWASFELDGVPCTLTRSGYTGEDGWEISAPAEAAERLARRLLAEPEVEPAGLGARDSLRLEAGLCLYGSDIDTTTTPIEAGLAWTIGKRRRAEGGFPGADVILAQIQDKPARRRVGLRPDGKAPARAHTDILDPSGTVIGEVTSGGFGPSVDGPVAMGYVDRAQSAEGTEVAFAIRGRELPGRVVRLPFVQHRYFRG